MSQLDMAVRLCLTPWSAAKAGALVGEPAAERIIEYSVKPATNVQLSCQLGQRIKHTIGSLMTPPASNNAGGVNPATASQLKRATQTFSWPSRRRFVHPARPSKIYSDLGVFWCCCTSAWPNYWATSVLISRKPS